MKSMINMQRRYWDGLSGEYQAITRISVSDFHYGPQIPGESRLRLLPRFNGGEAALELGCGAAQNSIWLAGCGARCTAVDISEGQLGYASELAKVCGVKLRLIKSPLESFRDAVKGRFDFIHSSHAMEFVDDPAAVILSVAKALRPGGHFMLSTVHPLYNGEWIAGEYEESESSIGDGLFLPSYFSPPDDVRYDEDGKAAVISRAYPVSAWFNWLRDAGLEVVRFEEPRAVPPSGNPPYTSDAWAEPDDELAAIPNTVIYLARKPAK